MFSNRTFYIGDDVADADSASSPQAKSHNDNLVDTAADTRSVSHNSTSSCQGWFTQNLTSQCGCSNNYLVKGLGLTTLLTLCWLLLVVLLGGEALPGGGLFTLLTLVLVAQLVGGLVDLAGLPSILGMLVTGIVVRSLGLYTVSEVYLNIVSTLREVALGVILIKAGLGLDPVALLKLSFTVIRLAVCPGLMEAVTVAVMTHYVLDYPWLWGFALGFLMCAISPAVVVPTLLKLKKEGYGEGKGISTLVIAASSIDDVLAISVFSICISIIFSTGESLVMQMLQGPMDVCVGLAAGAMWGVVCGLTPHLDDEMIVWKRVAMVGGAGLCAVLGSSYVGFPGAGPLAAITAAFVAAIVWKLQGGVSANIAVEEVFSSVWAVMQPVLFGLIGAEIDLRQLELEIVTWGLIIIAAALVIRVLTCSLVLVGGKLNFKEVVFVNLAWLPKATVQAALAPQVLDMVRKMTAPPAEDLERGSQFLTIAVLSILITAPLGAVGASVAGPRLLAKHPSSHVSRPDQNL